MSEDFIIEIDGFPSIVEAKDWCKGNIRQAKGKEMNIISRNITVVTLKER